MHSGIFWWHLRFISRTIGANAPYSYRCCLGIRAQSAGMICRRPYRRLGNESLSIRFPRKEVLQALSYSRRQTHQCRLALISEDINITRSHPNLRTDPIVLAQTRSSASLCLNNFTHLPHRGKRPKEALESQSRSETIVEGPPMGWAKLGRGIKNDRADSKSLLLSATCLPALLVQSTS
jgi:hypothetical protein